MFLGVSIDICLNHLFHCRKLCHSDSRCSPLGPLGNNWVALGLFLLASRFCGSEEEGEWGKISSQTDLGSDSGLTTWWLSGSGQLRSKFLFSCVLAPPVFPAPPITSYSDKEEAKCKVQNYHPGLGRRFHDGSHCAPGQATSFIFLVKWALYNKTWDLWLQIIPKGLLQLTTAPNMFWFLT